MKRGGPLKRTTPLKSSSTLKRTPMKRTPMKKTVTVDPITPAVHRAVEKRSGGLCEARLAVGCYGIAQHKHHRKLRRAGDHRAVCLLHVCFPCHKLIHDHPDWSYEHGYMVRQTDDPAKVLVVRPQTC